MSPGILAVGHSSHYTEETRLDRLLAAATRLHGFVFRQEDQRRDAEAQRRAMQGRGMAGLQSEYTRIPVPILYASARICAIRWNGGSWTLRLRVSVLLRALNLYDRAAVCADTDEPLAVPGLDLEHKLGSVHCHEPGGRRD